MTARGEALGQLGLIPNPVPTWPSEEIRLAVEEIKRSRQLVRHVFRIYSDACVARNSELVSELEKERSHAGARAERALENLFRVLDESHTD
jgi:ribosomal protein L1